jgi:hypothetical protein
MATAVGKITKLVDASDRYDISPAALLPVQIEAASERLAAHGASIQFVKNRIEDTGVKCIGEPADLVPLLLAHTAYKSYPETWLEKGRWPQLTEWLDTISANRVREIDNANVGGVDTWIDRLAAKGHYINCSSGTTGKISMIPSSMVDRRSVQRILVAAYEWASGLSPKQQHKMVIFNLPTNNFRYLDCFDALITAYCRHEGVFRLPGEPITVGRVRQMVILRKSIKDGTARPADIAAYEALVDQRIRMVEGTYNLIAETLVKARARPFLMSGMFDMLFKVSEIVRSMGFSRKDFHPENLMMVSGGLKGAELPPDYRERIMETFNVNPRHAMSMYGMQELNTLFPRCNAGRYHVPPWVLVLVLDQPGEQLVGPLQGEVEGRAGFFEFSHDARWGGLISGDKIMVDYGKCTCGHQGPTVGDNVVRYSDLPGGDKISCAGTIDAYVRGVG